MNPTFRPKTPTFQVSLKLRDERSSPRALPVELIMLPLGTSMHSRERRSLATVTTLCSEVFVEVPKVSHRSGVGFERFADSFRTQRYTNLRSPTPVIEGTPQTIPHCTVREPIPLKGRTRLVSFCYSESVFSLSQALVNFDVLF